MVQDRLKIGLTYEDKLYKPINQLFIKLEKNLALFHFPCRTFLQFSKQQQSFFAIRSKINREIEDLPLEKRVDKMFMFLFV